MRTFYQDLCYRWRVLLGNAGFTTAAVLTLPIGPAATTTAFGWIDAILLHPLPGVAEGDRFVLELTTSGCEEEDGLGRSAGKET